jgi:hypothetical protein
VTETEPETETETGPDRARPDQTRPGHARRRTATPGRSRPGEDRPDQTGPDQLRPGQTRSDHTRHDLARPGHIGPGQTMQDGARTRYSTGTSTSARTRTSPDQIKPVHHRRERGRAEQTKEKERERERKGEATTLRDDDSECERVAATEGRESGERRKEEAREKEGAGVADDDGAEGRGEGGKRDSESKGTGEGKRHQGCETSGGGGIREEWSVGSSAQGAREEQQRRALTPLANDAEIRVGRPASEPNAHRSAPLTCVAPAQQLPLPEEEAVHPAVGLPDGEVEASTPNPLHLGDPVARGAGDMPRQADVVCGMLGPWRIPDAKTSAESASRSAGRWSQTRAGNIQVMIQDFQDYVRATSSRILRIRVASCTLQRPDHAAVFAGREK